MKSDASSPEHSDLLDNLRWARELAVQLVGEAFADDVLQETRLAALNSQPELARTRSWLRAVLKRFALQRLRSEKARKNRERSVARNEALPSPADLAARLEQQQLIARAVSTLGEPYRSTLLLRYSEGLEPKQIAERLGIPAGTVRWRLKQAVDSLREKLDREHSGDRGAWALALCPLLVAPPASRAKTIAGVELIKVSLVMQKIYATAALVVLASLAAWQLGALDSPERDAEVEFAAKTALTEPEMNFPLAKPLAAKRSSESVAATEASMSAKESLTGWWLVGRVDGIPPGDSTKTELLIVGRSAAAEHTMRAHTESDGSVRIDLAEIFEANDLLPHELRVTASHAGLRPSEQSWSVDREQRQAGFRSGQIALFELQLKLRPPLGVVVGEVQVPDGSEGRDLRVALIPVTDRAPSGCPVDQGSCNSKGEFRLQYSDSGLYHVLVMHAEKLLLPGFAEVNVNGGETVLASAITLTEGEIVSGLITWNGAKANFEVECELATLGGYSARFCPALKAVAFNAGSYEYTRRSVTTKQQGEFRLSGLSTGKHRFMARAIRIDEDSIDVMHGYGAHAGMSFEVPTAPLLVEFLAQIRMFSCVSDGRAVPRVGVTVLRGENWATRRTTGVDGRFALMSGADTHDGSIEFQALGFATETRALGDSLPGLSTEVIEMEPNALATGTLLVELTGDVDRRLERFSIQLNPATESKQSETDPDPWRSKSWKRTDDPLRIGGIRPGVYDLALAANDPTNSSDQHYPDTASMILNETREITIAAGEVSRVSIELELGGRLWVPALSSTSEDEIPSGTIHFRIVNLQGQLAKGRWVTESGPGGNGTFSGGIYRAENCFFDPPLRAGHYTLEVWRAEDESDLIASPFKVTAGEVTTLEIVDPR